jgi:hypothetical protein
MFDSAQSSTTSSVLVNGVEYVPAQGFATLPETPDPIGKSEPYWSFLKSPQFGMIVVASFASVLVRDDFQTMPWNQIVGQILTLIGSGAAGFGLLNKMSKNVSVK